MFHTYRRFHRVTSIVINGQNDECQIDFIINMINFMIEMKLSFFFSAEFFCLYGSVEILVILDDSFAHLNLVIINHTSKNATPKEIY